MYKFAVAGAVVGTMVGATLLLLLCLWPFLLRCWRGRGQEDGRDQAEKAEFREGAGYASVAADERQADASPSSAAAVDGQLLLEIDKETEAGMEGRGKRATKPCRKGLLSPPAGLATDTRSREVDSAKQDRSKHGRFSRISQAMHTFTHTHLFFGHGWQQDKRSERHSGLMEEATSSVTGASDARQLPGHDGQEILYNDPDARGEAWDYFHPSQSEDESVLTSPDSSRPGGVGPTEKPDLVRAATGQAHGGMMEDDDVLGDSGLDVAAMPRLRPYSTSPTDMSLPRVDSLPLPTIVSDMPTPCVRAAAEPSGNPMDLMQPTNAVEKGWMVTQEILKMETSPSPGPGPEAGSGSGPEPRPAPRPAPRPEARPENSPLPVMEVDVAVPADTATVGGGHEGKPEAGGGFRCGQCDRIFDHVHKLNHHKRYHEKPHACTHDGCDMRFGTKTHLVRHVNDRHKKSRKFYCTVAACQFSKQGGKGFPRKDNWRRHMVNKHQIMPSQEAVEYHEEEMDVPLP